MPETGGDVAFGPWLRLGIQGVLAGVVMYLVGWMTTRLSNDLDRVRDVVQTHSQHAEQEHGELLRMIHEIELAQANGGVEWRAYLKRICYQVSDDDQQRAACLTVPSLPTVK